MDKVKVVFLKPVYPYKRGETGEIKAKVAENFVKKGYCEYAENESKPSTKKVVEVKTNEVKEETVENKSMEKKTKKTK